MKTEIIVLLLIIAFGLFLCFAFFYGPGLLAGSDPITYSNVAYLLLAHGPRASQDGIFGTKYILIGGISLFYLLLGTGPFPAALFGVATFIGTIVLLYLIGKSLYGYRVGLVAAFLYSFYPMAVLLSPSVGDDVPMTFFAVLAVFLLVKGAMDNKNRKGYYIFSGFAGVLSFGVSASGAIILVFIMAFLIVKFLYEIGYQRLLDIVSLLLGIVMCLMLIAIFSYLQSGNPTYAFTTVYSCYASGNYTNGNGGNSLCPSQSGYADQLSSYISFALPYNFSNIYNAVYSIPNPEQFLKEISTPQHSTNSYDYFSGYFFYFAIAAALILIFKYDKRLVFPGSWFFITFLYLSFGTTSLLKYETILPDYRYSLLCTPPIMLIIALGAVRLYDDSKKSKKYMAICALVLLFLFLILTSLYLIKYVGYSENNTPLYRIRQIGSFIDSLPQNASVIATDYIYPILYAYGGDSHSASFMGIGSYSCSNIPDHTYIVAALNQSYQSRCLLSLVFQPARSPEYLENYTLFSSNPVFPNANDYNLVVYYKN